MALLEKGDCMGSMDCAAAATGAAAGSSAAASGRLVALMETEELEFCGLTFWEGPWLSVWIIQVHFSASGAPQVLLEAAQESQCSQYLVTEPSALTVSLLSRQ